PQSESTKIQGNGNECIIHWQIATRYGEKTVADVAMDQTHGGQMGHAIVQMTPLYPGHARKVGHLTAEIMKVKVVTVVDESIDIRHRQSLDMIWNSLVNPAEDVEIFKSPSPRGMDPSRDSQGMGGRMIIDATHKSGHTYPDVSLPPKECLWKAYESWQAAGLPAFKIPDRVERALDWHEKRMERSVDGQFMGMEPRPLS
ncbi:MAG: UbiD family decarboxylase, partial [Deltaproteobacteria bacterium]|nr:UbiD family decarboxylase [Deltaproteobacteria bacterium]